MKRESIVNPAHELPVPDAERLWRRVREMEANGIHGLIPLVQAVAAEYGDDAYTIAQQVFASLGYEVSLEQLKDPNEKGVSSYPWR
jgi:hypothetical protein